MLRKKIGWKKRKFSLLSPKGGDDSRLESCIMITDAVVAAAGAHDVVSVDGVLCSVVTDEH